MTKIQPKSKVMTAREQSYLSYLEKYPVLATLMILEDYEKEEKYEECAVIKRALDKKGDFTKSSQYYSSKEFTPTSLNRENKTARKKANYIKLKLPL